MVNGMRQLAGTKKTRYRRAYAAPLAGLISDRVQHSTPRKSGKNATIHAKPKKTGRYEITFEFTFAAVTIFQPFRTVQEITDSSAATR